jgi:trans-aconitate methyltransferase
MANTSWNAKFYDTKLDYVSRYGTDLLPLLNPQPGERILDLGCGTGTLTYEIAKTGANVIGIDSSPEMINQAKAKHPEIEFKTQDGHDFQFDILFDAVFSNAALHWMTEPQKVIACVSHCLKKQGRFVLEMGGIGNIHHVLTAISQAANEFGVSALPLINYYPSISEYTGLLETEGLRVIYAELINRPTRLMGATGLRDWVRMFRNAVLTQIPETQHEIFFQRIENIARADLYQNNEWWADYVRLRVIAIKR